MLPLNWLLLKWIQIVFLSTVYTQQQFEPLAIANQPIPLITRSNSDHTGGDNSGSEDDGDYLISDGSNLNRQQVNSNNKRTKQKTINRNVINIPNRVNVYHNKSLNSKVSSQQSSLTKLTNSNNQQSSVAATVNHGELADGDEDDGGGGGGGGGGGSAGNDGGTAVDYDYRANDLPDWMPPPPPPPPVSLPPPPSSGSPSSLSSLSLLSSSPSSLQLGSFPGRIPHSASYPLSTQTSAFHVLPRQGPFPPRPFESGAGPRDEFTLFLVILTIAGFFGLIISMFMPFTLLLQSQQQSLGPPLYNQQVYPIQSGLVQPAQLGTGAVVAGGKRRRRSQINSPTVISIMNSLRESSIKFNDN